MEVTDPALQLKQAQFIFWLNMAMTVFAFFVFMKSLDSPHLWKVICSAAGFAVFLSLTTLLLIRIVHLRKSLNNRS